MRLRTVGEAVLVLLRTIAARPLMWTGLCRRFTIPLRGFRLRFYPTRLSAVLWANRDAREEDVAFIQAYLRPGDVLVDVGANIGVVTLAGSVVVGPRGRVIAIEPHPRTIEYLKGNLALNAARNVESCPVALGAVEGTVGFSDREADDRNHVRPNGGDLEVPVRRLDTLLADVPTIHILKVDVEGYEQRVFEGAPATLARTCCVYFESWERHSSRYGIRSGDVIGLLARHGLESFRFAGLRTLAPVSEQYRSRRLENLVAVRDRSTFLERTGYRIGEPAAAAVWSAYLQA